MAVKFDLYNNQSGASNSTGLMVNEARTSAGSIDLGQSSINLHSGHLFNVSMTYDGATLKVTIIDSATQASASQSYAVDIPTIVGASTAFVGFTGGTGGLTATQNILNWTYTPLAGVSAAVGPVGAAPRRPWYPLQRGSGAQFNFSNGRGTVPAGYISNVGMVYASAGMQPASKEQETDVPKGSYRIHLAALTPGPLTASSLLRPKGYYRSERLTDEHYFGRGARESPDPLRQEAGAVISETTIRTIGASSDHGRKFSVAPESHRPYPPTTGLPRAPGSPAQASAARRTGGFEEVNGVTKGDAVDHQHRAGRL